MVPRVTWGLILLLALNPFLYVYLGFLFHTSLGVMGLGCELFVTFMKINAEKLFIVIKLSYISSILMEVITSLIKS